MVVQLVRIPACHAGGRGFESRPLRQPQEAAVAQLVERNLAKVEVESSRLFCRSSYFDCGLSKQPSGLRGTVVFSRTSSHPQGWLFSLLLGNLARSLLAARIAMGVSKRTPPGRKTAAIQNEAVRRDVMGRIFPFRLRDVCDLHHGYLLTHINSKPEILATMTFGQYRLAVLLFRLEGLFSLGARSLLPAPSRNLE